MIPILQRWSWRCAEGAEVLHQRQRMDVNYSFTTARQFVSSSSMSPNTEGKCDEEGSTSDAMRIDILFQRLAKVDTSSLCDAYKSTLRAAEEGQPSPSLHVMSPDIRPINGPYLSSFGARSRSRNPRVPLLVGEQADDRGEETEEEFQCIGLARTVQLQTQNDILAVLRGLDECQPRDVLVVNTSHSDKAVAGGLFHAEATRRQLGGVIVDGPVRDVRDVSLRRRRNRVVPFYAKSITPYSGTVSCPGLTGVDIQCGDVPVSTGDVVFGDEDGILVGPAKMFERVIDAAEHITMMERRLMEQMERGSGRRLHSMMNYEEHLRRCTRGEEGSMLEFVLDDMESGKQ